MGSTGKFNRRRGISGRYSIPGFPARGCRVGSERDGKRGLKMREIGGRYGERERERERRRERERGRERR